MFNKIIREPLVHFLFAGFLLFVYFNYYANDSGLDTTIVVNKDKLLNFLQFQSKAFNEEVFEAKLDQLSETEKNQLINNYVQDEVLYREALQLGLDQNDFVIKRRIIQKMEFILDDFDEANIMINEDSLLAFYKQNKQRYFQPAQYTFTHIFFKKEKQNKALDRAVAFMENPAHQKLSTSESLKYGDRFLYHRNYADKTSSFLEGQFGATFANALAKLNPSSHSWQGPLASEHGQHWVQIVKQAAAKIPSLSEIHNLVKSDYLLQLKKQHKEKRIEKLKKNYEVALRMEN